MGTDKLYILNIRMENQFKRLYFEGADSEETDHKFNNLRKDVPDIGGQSADWIAYVDNVIEHFQKNGFNRIQG